MTSAKTQRHSLQAKILEIGEAGGVELNRWLADEVEPPQIAPVRTVSTRNERAQSTKSVAAARNPWISGGLAWISAGFSMAAGGVGSCPRPWWRWGSRTSLSQADQAQMAMRLLRAQVLAASRVGDDRHDSCTCHGMG